MEEIVNKIELEDNQIINIDNNNLLSVLFKNYQKSLKAQIKADINNNIGKYTIADLNIKSNDVFLKVIDEKFQEIKKNSLLMLDTYIDRYKNFYEQYQKQILKFIEIKGESLYRVVNNNIKNDVILDYAINNIFKIINNLTEIYENILNNIEKNFNLLNEFLEKCELINEKKPIEVFLNNKANDILNCSLINQFNFNEIDNINNAMNNDYKHYFNYLREEKKVELWKNLILKKEEIEKGEEYIKDKCFSLKKLKMIGIETKNFYEIADFIKKNKNTLKRLTIKNFDLSEKIKLEQAKELEFNNTEKLKFISGRYLNPQNLLDLFLNNNVLLIHLSLENVNFSNVGFKLLMKIFKLRPIFFETLEYLSLARNAISAVATDIFSLKEMKDKKFKKLKVFNLYKNNIYKFHFLLDRMPELKLLDLSSNSLLTGTTMEGMIKEKDKLVLFNDNIFITNNFNNNSKYIDYLNEALPHFDFGIKVLHLGFTYDKETQENLGLLKLSPVLNISLIKLDLSFCGITNDVMIKFLKNNYGFFSLKSLNLKFNNLDSNIFSKFVDEGILLETLRDLDLSENELSCKEYEENVGLIKFIEKFKSLEKIILMNSKFIDRWIVNISPDLDRKGFRKLFLEFINKLKLDKRGFKIILDHYIYIEEDLKQLFHFKED